jgi:signal peptidase
LVARIVKNILAALICLAVVVPAVLLVTGVLPYRVFIVHTGSMSPTIPSKSAVIVKEGVFGIGQVISYRSANGVVTHRLVKRTTDGMLVTKGDANRTDDPGSVPSSAVVGGVVAAPRMLGYWLMYLKNPAGLASLFMTMVCLWLIYSTTAGYAKREQQTGGAVAVHAIGTGASGIHVEQASVESRQATRPLPVKLRCSRCGVSLASAEKLRAHAAEHGGRTHDEREQLRAAARFVGEPFIVGSRMTTGSRPAAECEGRSDTGRGSVAEQLPLVLRCSHCGAGFSSTQALRTHMADHGTPRASDRDKRCGRSDTR